MDATISIKMSVKELDVLRGALERDVAAQNEIVRNSLSAASERAAARQLAFLGSEVLKKLK